MKNPHLYPENWNDTIRPEILRRDGYKCQKCLVPHRAHVYYGSGQMNILMDDFQIQWAKDQGKKVIKIHLQVAHIDHDKSNCAYSNLEALCPKCHLNFDREFNKLLRKIPGRQKKKQF